MYYAIDADVKRKREVYSQRRRPSYTSGQGKILYKTYSKIKLTIVQANTKKTCFGISYHRFTGQVFDLLVLRSDLNYITN